MPLYRSTRLAIVASVSKGLNYYVDATLGNDSNDGRAPGDAWQTIAKVNASTFLPGDGVLFKRGETWSGENGLLFVSNGEPSNEIVIGAYGSGASPIWALDTQCDIRTCMYVTIRDIVIDGTNLPADHACIKIWHEALHVTMHTCEVKNGPNQGILVQQTDGGEVRADYNQIINCTVHDNGTTQLHHGIYIETSNNLVDRCAVYNNTGYGIHVYNVTTTCHNNVVRYCESYDNAQAGGDGSGILLGSGDANQAYYNLCWGNKHGIHVEFSSPTNTLIYNNSCYDNFGYGIGIEGGDGAIVRNNIAYPEGWNEYHDGGTGTTASNNVFAADPLFVNPVANDFHLQSGSPARNAGLDLGFAVDYDGVIVPQETNPAIGAYEYVA